MCRKRICIVYTNKRSMCIIYLGGSQLVTDVPTVKAYLNNVSIEKNDKIEQEDNKKDE